MARRYSFGQTNTGSRNLSSLIQSLSTSMQDARDAEEFDAFNNGGVGPDGKPVTPASLLAYIKGRIGDYSPQDPSYIKWQDKLTQTEFSIGESNIGAAYKAGKASASAVASFYRSWLGKAPVGSAFYDKIENQISAFQKAGRSGAGGGVVKALNAKLTGLYATAALGNNIDAAVVREAMREGLAHPYGNGTSITDYNAGDIEALVGSRSSLQLQNGQTIPFSMSVWASKDQGSLSALKAAQAAIVSAGRTVPKELQTAIQQRSDATLSNESVDVRAKADLIDANLNEALARAGGDAVAGRAAYQTAVEAYQKLTTTKGFQNADDLTKGGINADISVYSGNGKPGMTDQNGVKLDDSIKALAATQTIAQQLDAHILVMGQTTPGGPMQPVSAAKANDPNMKTGAYLGADGQMHTGLFAGQPVFGVAIKDPGGQPVDTSNLPPGQLQYMLANGYTEATSKNALGYTFNIPGASGTGLTTVYGSLDSTGTMQYSSTPPWGGGVAPDGSGNLLLGPDGKPVPPQTAPPTTSVLAGPGIGQSDLIHADQTPDPTNPGNSLLGTPLGALTPNINAAQGFFNAVGGQIGGLGPDERGAQTLGSMDDIRTASIAGQTQANLAAMGNPSVSAQPATPIAGFAGRSGVLSGVPDHNYQPGWSNTPTVTGSMDDVRSGLAGPQPIVPAPQADIIQTSASTLTPSIKLASYPSSVSVPSVVPSAATVDVKNADLIPTPQVPTLPPLPSDGSAPYVPPGGHERAF